MKRWIRPQGIVVFFALVLTVTVFVFILSGTIVKRGIEKAGTAVVGAQVDVGSASISLSPLGLALSGLQVTNPRRPMENTVQVERIAFNMDPWALLRRKMLIEEMVLEGMAFNTPRKRTGAVLKSERDRDEGGPGEGFHLPTLKTPPVSEILAQEELLSVERSEALQKRVAAVEKSMGEARKDLPDQAEVTEYRQRLDNLLSASDLTRARLEEAKALQKEIRSERDKVQAVRDRITENISSLRIQLKEARSSVGEDVDRLKEKYALTPGGLANMTRILFGDQAGTWADRGVQVMKLIRYLPVQTERTPEKVRPPRGKGVDVPLKDRIPLPDFWVRRAALSFKVPSGAISGEALDFSSNQVLLKKPATFKVSGKDLPGGASLKAAGALDHTDPAEPRDKVNLYYAGWRVADLSLSGSANLPVALRKGSGTLAGSVTLMGESLEGSTRMDFTSADFDVGGASDSSLARAIRTSLDRIEKFSLTADIGGTLEAPMIRLSSDLDRILKDAVGRAVQEETKNLETGLRTALEERTRAAMSDAEKSLERLESVRAELQTIKTNLEEALKAKATTNLPF